MLDIRNLGVNYGPIQAVRGISLTVAAGEIVGMIGPNGAGKSSTLLAISGALRPTTGEVTYDGVSLVGSAPEAIVRQGVSLVPEGRRIFAELTVEENLKLGSRARRRAATTLPQDLDGIYERFPALHGYRKGLAGKLSGGEQQQLAIARALVARPRLLLLDEPSLGLAPKMIDRVFETLEELRTDGVTILLVEQNAEVTLEIADRVYALNTGIIQVSGASEALRGSTDFAEMYLGVA